MRHLRCSRSGTKEVLEWTDAVAGDQHAAVEQAVHACPVQAVRVSVSGMHA